MHDNTEIVSEAARISANMARGGAYPEFAQSPILEVLLTLLDHSDTSVLSQVLGAVMNAAASYAADILALDGHTKYEKEPSGFIFVSFFSSL